MLNVILYLGRKCLFREWCLSKFFSFEELNVKQQQKRKIDEKTELKGRSPK